MSAVKGPTISRVAIAPRDKVRAVTESAIASGRADMRDVASVERSLNSGAAIVMYDAGTLMRLQRAANCPK